VTIRSRGMYRNRRRRAAAPEKMETRTRRTTTAIKLMKEIAPQVVSGHAKVTVVGCGQVGMAAAFSMLTVGVCSDLALVDMRKDAALGEKLDLTHGLAFLGRQVHIDADSDYSISAVLYAVDSEHVTVYVRYNCGPNSF